MIDNSLRAHDVPDRCTRMGLAARGVTAPRPVAMDENNNGGPTVHREPSGRQAALLSPR
jgi:hypothetical protein